MTSIIIPPAALEAGAVALLEQLDAIADEDGLVREREELTPEEQELFRRVARAACLAMIEAWPGMHFIGNIGVHLPLPTEASDE